MEGVVLGAIGKIEWESVETLGNWIEKTSCKSQRHQSTVSVPQAGSLWSKMGFSSWSWSELDTFVSMRKGTSWKDLPYRKELKLLSLKGGLKASKLLEINCFHPTSMKLLEVIVAIVAAIGTGLAEWNVNHFISEHVVIQKRQRGKSNC